MKFVSESFDEQTNEYVYTFETNQEEYEKINEYCEQNHTSFNKIANTAIKNMLENPEEMKKFKQWVKENREDKLPKGVVGKPVLKRGDKVGIYSMVDTEDMFFEGTVEKVDAYGTFFQNEEPSYDILVTDYPGSMDGRCLMKHNRESSCYRLS